jgi:hypothetical protein
VDVNPCSTVSFDEDIGGGSYIKETGMTDMFGVQKFGGAEFAQVTPLDQSKPIVPQIADTANDGSALSHQGADLPGQNGAQITLLTEEASASERSVSIEPRQQEPAIIIYSANMVTGPTPTFQVSLMDLGTELRNEIAMSQAKQTFVPDIDAGAPVMALSVDAQMAASSASDGIEASDTSSILSAEVSSPTERRDTQTLQPVIDLAAKVTATDDILPQAPQLMPRQVQDPEAAYAGTIALQARPYDANNMSA